MTAPRFWLLISSLGWLVAESGCLISFDDYPTGDICDAEVAEARALDDPALRKCASERAKVIAPLDAGADTEVPDASDDGP